MYKGAGWWGTDLTIPSMHPDVASTRTNIMEGLPEYSKSKDIHPRVAATYKAYNKSNPLFPRALFDQYVRYRSMMENRKKTYTGADRGKYVKAVDSTIAANASKLIPGDPTPVTTDLMRSIEDKHPKAKFITLRDPFKSGVALPGSSSAKRRSIEVPKPNVPGGRQIALHEYAHYVDPSFYVPALRYNTNKEPEIPAMVTETLAGRYPQAMRRQGKTVPWVYRHMEKHGPQLTGDNAKDINAIEQWMQRLRGVRADGKLPTGYPRFKRDPNILNKMYKQWMDMHTAE